MTNKIPTQPSSPGDARLQELVETQSSSPEDSSFLPHKYVKNTTDFTETGLSAIDAGLQEPLTKRQSYTDGVYLSEDADGTAKDLIDLSSFEVNKSDGRDDNADTENNTETENNNDNTDTEIQNLISEFDPITNKDIPSTAINRHTPEWQSENICKFMIVFLYNQIIGYYIRSYVF